MILNFVEPDLQLSGDTAPFQTIDLTTEVLESLNILGVKIISASSNKIDLLQGDSTVWSGESVDSIELRYLVAEILFKNGFKDLSFNESTRSAIKDVLGWLIMFPSKGNDELRITVTSIITRIWQFKIFESIEEIVDIFLETNYIDLLPNKDEFKALVAKKIQYDNALAIDDGLERLCMWFSYPQSDASLFILFLSNLTTKMVYQMDKKMTVDFLMNGLIRNDSNISIKNQILKVLEEDKTLDNFTRNALRRVLDPFTDNVES